MIALMGNAMRLQALRASGARTSSRIGIVTSYDPTNYALIATLQPENLQTGNLSIAAAWVGNGWGMFAPPSPGDRIAVELIDGDLDAGFAECRFFDQANRPLEVQAGEFWLVHKSGTYFKLLNTGAATFSDTKGATLTLDGAGNITSQASHWTHTGDVSVTGKITASSDIASTGGDVSDQKSTIQSMRDTYNDHTQPISGSTADAPTQQMT
ncbi:MAG: hypothetical protein ACREUT_10560 [Steroidobacteraceae bacterium]